MEIYIYVEMNDINITGTSLAVQLLRLCASNPGGMGSIPLGTKVLHATQCGQKLYIYMYICICIYIHTHMCTHIHTHTYIAYPKSWDATRAIPGGKCIKCFNKNIKCLC